MKLLTSFISEHSIEYVLVPRIFNILSKNFNKVVPIFFWATREGGLHARESLSQMSFKVLAIYPRRPKIDIVGDKNVHLKLNQMLFERSAEFEQRGIPLLVGLPLISSLLDFQLDIPCLWLYIHPHGIEEQFLLALDSPNIISDSASIVNESDLCSFVKGKCQNIPGSELNEIMRQAKSGFNEYRMHGLFSDQYKPTYILIPNQ